MVAIATERLTKVFDDGTVAVDGLNLEVASGEFVAILGPTACGKTTVLRLIAGIERPTSGHVLMDGRVVDGLTARERRVAMVFQDYALYPNLTVAQNIGLPLRMGNDRTADVSGRVAEAAAQLRIGHLLRARPENLSGGQRHRVAMARAIVRDPHAFLLDEPMSNLDAGLRAELRSDVAALARRLAVTTLYVTHDRTEAMAVADRVAILRGGALQQIGPPGQVYADPANLFVATFLGARRPNVLPATIHAYADRVIVDLGPQVIEFAPDHPRSASLMRWHDEQVSIVLRPDALSPVPADVATGPTLRGAVRQVEDLGEHALVHLETGLLAASTSESGLEPPEAEHHLAAVLADDPPHGRVPQQAVAPVMPHPRPGATTATEPASRSGHPAPHPEPPLPADLVVRVAGPGLAHPGEPMALAVDVDQLLLFDGGGNRIRLP
jgi:multiple sugar transport system ATP-binding protein